MISYKKVVGLPVLVAEDEQEVGRVKKLVINFDNGNFLGLLLSAGILEKDDRVIRIDDIDEFRKDAVLISSERVISPINEIGILRNLLKKNIKIKGNKVVTESGDELGEVKDFEVDDVVYKIAKLFVSSGVLKDLFKGELIISFNEIVLIGKDAIIVKDKVVREGKEEAVVSKVESKRLVSDVAMSKDKNC